MSGYSPHSSSSKRSLPPSLSPSLSPRKRPYDHFPHDVPSAPGSVSGPSMAYHHRSEAEDSMMSDDDMQPSLAPADEFGMRQNEEGEMELDELDTGEPEEAEEGEPGWKCAWSRCGRLWKDQAALVKHLHNDHIGINKEWYTCKWDDCRRKGDKQATRHALITHVRAHTGERPYTCTQPNCTKTFTRSDAMNKHLRSIHNVPAELANPRTAARLITRPPYPEHPDYPSLVGPLPMDIPSHIPSPVGETFHDSPIHPPEVMPEYSRPPSLSRQDSAQEQEKAKAKPRSRTTSGKKPTAPRSKKPGPPMSTGPIIPSPLQPPIIDYAQHPAPSLPPVTVGPDGVTYIRFGSDADLMTDPDLYEVMPRIRNRPVLQVTPDDARALDYVRIRNPRRGQGAGRKPKPKKKPDNPDDVIEDGGESDDSFDEGTAKVHADESHLEIGRIGEAGVMGERSVFGRSRWAAKYIMAKAKLMLAEEEMRMRLAELNNILDEEEGLRQNLEDMSQGGAEAAWR